MKYTSILLIIATLFLVACGAQGDNDITQLTATTSEVKTSEQQVEENVPPPVQLTYEQELFVDFESNMFCLQLEADFTETDITTNEQMRAIAIQRLQTTDSEIKRVRALTERTEEIQQIILERTQTNCPDLVEEVGIIFT